MWSVLHIDHLTVRKAAIRTGNLLVAYVSSERERQNTAVKNTASVAGSLLFYPLEIPQH
jgi:hypothetical protein